ncbi:unnamed protein product [Adineta ricciae]|uniref:Tetraspanin n=1 Tax=Adineta ricciae TaxID=249248 RepID=A0A814HH54_ADIRI|nr:unnamed protein product [Adineta ricciae]CAF1009399.1 unnamed protein product [Adineta ricciae]
MGVANCYPCAKYLLLVLNLFFWLSGLALILLGIYSLLLPEVQHIIQLFNFTTLPLSSIEIAVCLILLFGIVIFLIGLFGYCGAKRESRTCLILYIVLITCVLLLELALFIYIAMYYDQGQLLVKQRLVSQMKKYNHMYPSQYEKAIDYIQSKYHCCGIDSAYDYNDSHVPLSCCSMISTTSCTVHQVGLTGTPGCYSPLTRTTFFWGKFFILLEIGLCGLSLIGVFLAICVCQNAMLYDEYTQTPYYI